MKPLMMYPACYVCGAPSLGKVEIKTHNLKAEPYRNQNFHYYTTVELPACDKHSDEYAYRGAHMGEYFPDLIESLK